MTTDLVAFLAAVILEGDLDHHRSELSKLAAELGFKLHYGEMSSVSRRTEAVEAITTIDGWGAFVLESSSPVRAGAGREHRIRGRALKEAFVFLDGTVGVGRVVLETRAQQAQGLYTLDENDHKVLQGLRGKGRVSPGFSIHHANKDELILGIADVIASSRTDLLTSKNEEIYQLLGHRVRSIHTVS